MEWKKAKRKSTTVKAFQITREILDIGVDIPGLSSKVASNIDPEYDFFIVETKKGKVKARIDDWVIEDSEGDLHFCNPGIFAKTYSIIPEKKGNIESESEENELEEDEFENAEDMLEDYKSFQCRCITIAKKITIPELIKECHRITVERDFWGDEERNDGELIALMHSELSEALEILRRNGPKKALAEELADLCIRVFDYCGGREIDLETAIRKKMEINKTRSYKHGKKFQKGINNENDKIVNVSQMWRNFYGE